MSTATPNTDRSQRHPALPQRPQPGARRPATPLTDDQYLATSLALIAKLSRRMRGGMHRHG